MQIQSKDAFPIDIKKNPKDCTVATLRCGREIENRKEEEKNKTEKEENEEIGKDTKLSSSELIEEVEKEEVQTEHRVDVFKKIEINLPFAEALTQMPNYAKFLNDILSKKRKFTEEGVVNLTETCNAVIQKSIPEKMQDPSSITIPYTD